MRPDISNIVRELSRFVTKAQRAHVVALERLMVYCLSTKDRGMMIAPIGDWKGNREKIKLLVEGYSDSDYARDLNSYRSVSEYGVFINKAPVCVKSKRHESVSLLVTEEELVAAIQCVQEMLYVKKVIESIELYVELPMSLTMDSKGAKDIINNWSVGGRMRHIEVKYYFLRELKEKGLIKVEWIYSEDNCSDIFTKHLNGAAFHKHIQMFCGSEIRGEGNLKGEGVGNTV
jgi:uncharacterized protein YlbG (UPF0298 family)